MAKKNRSPRGYYTGGRVMADGGPAPTVEIGRVAEDASEVNPLQTALDAQLRAQQLADPHARLMAEIEKMDVSDAKKRVLMAHPELVADPLLARAAAWHYQTAIAEGVEDDSPELIERVLNGAYIEAAKVQQAARRGARPEPLPEPPEPEHADDPGQEEIEPSYAPAAPAVQRHIPVSAPVSRGTSIMSGRPAPGTGKMTLTAEEREIARNSFTDPNMTNAQKEYLYAQNKAKLLRLRASGEYRQTTEQNG